MSSTSTIITQKEWKKVWKKCDYRVCFLNVFDSLSPPSTMIPLSIWEWQTTEIMKPLLWISLPVPEWNTICCPSSLWLRIKNIDDDQKIVNVYHLPWSLALMYNSVSSSSRSLKGWTGVWNKLEENVDEWNSFFSKEDIKSCCGYLSSSLPIFEWTRNEENEINVDKKIRQSWQTTTLQFRKWNLLLNPTINPSVYELTECWKPNSPSLSIENVSMPLLWKTTFETDDPLSLMYMSLDIEKNTDLLFVYYEPLGIKWKPAWYAQQFLYEKYPRVHNSWWKEWFTSLPSTDSSKDNYMRYMYIGIGNVMDNEPNVLHVSTTTPFSKLKVIQYPESISLSKLQKLLSFRKNTSTQIGNLGKFEISSSMSTSSSWDLWTMMDMIQNSEWSVYIDVTTIHRRLDMMRWKWTNLLKYLLLPFDNQQEQVSGTFQWNVDKKQYIISWDVPIVSTLIPWMMFFWTGILQSYKHSRPQIWKDYHVYFKSFPKAIFPDIIWKEMEGKEERADRQLTIEEKKKMQLSELYPTLFRVGHYKLQCQKPLQPYLLSEEEALQISPDSRILFPPTTIGTIQPEYYSCNPNGVYKYMGLKPNEASPAMYLPCCFKTNQKDKNKEKLRILKSSGSTTTTNEEPAIMTTTGRKENRIRKDHMIKHVGQFGDIPDDMNAFFIRCLPEEQVLRVGIEQGSFASVHCLEYWWIHERHPFDEPRSSFELWKQLQRTLVKTEGTCVTSSFPYMTLDTILQEWEKCNPQGKQDVVDPFVWGGLLETFYNVHIFILYRNQDHQLLYGRPRTCRTVPPLIQTDQPVIILYQHAGGRLNIAYSDEMGVELLLHSSLVKLDSGYHYEFPILFLQEWYTLHPTFFFAGVSLFPIPISESWHSTAIDALGNVRWIHCRLKNKDDSILATAHLSYPVQNIHLPMKRIEKDQFRHVTEPYFDEWYQYYAQDQTIWSWVSIDILKFDSQHSANASMLWFWTIEHLIYKWKWTWILEFGSSSSPRIPSNSQDFISFHSTIDTLPQMEWKWIVRQYLRDTDVRSSYSSLQVLTDHVFLKRIYDIFQLLFMKWIQTQDSWNSILSPSLPMAISWTNLFWNQHVSKYKLSFDEWIQLKSIVLEHVHVDDIIKHGKQMGWIDDEHRYKYPPLENLKNSLLFQLQWYLCNEYQFVTQMETSSLSILPSVYEPTHSIFSRVFSPRTSPTPTSPGSTSSKSSLPKWPSIPQYGFSPDDHDHMILDSYPLITTSLFQTFETKDDIVPTTSTFWWTNAQENPWYPQIVFVQRCLFQPLQLYDAQLRFVKQGRACWSCDESSAGSEETKTSFERQVDILDIRTIDKTSFSSSFQKVYIIQPKTKKNDETIAWVWSPTPFPSSSLSGSRYTSATLTTTDTETADTATETADTATETVTTRDSATATTMTIDDHKDQRGQERCQSSVEINTECCICFQPCRVPVKMGFPCRRFMNKPNCSSFTRVCLLCARNYLQLDRPSNERSPSVKCFTCSSILPLSRLNAIRAYEKDFYIMHRDVNIYNCPYEPDCTFQGNQMDLHHHLLEECSFRILSCRGCREFFKASDECTHRHSCPHYLPCPICQDYVLVIQFLSHLQSVHEKQYCRECGTTVDETRFSHHQTHECPARIVRCTICQLNVVFHSLPEHIQIHIQESERRMIQTFRQFQQTKQEHQWCLDYFHSMVQEMTTNVQEQHEDMNEDETTNTNQDIDIAEMVVEDTHLNDSNS